jgi:AcrR family transcriptional regulator
VPSSIDGHAVRTQRTRARILEASLALFNERGEAGVTTGMIAEALGMSPGNLYYHFRNKDQIVRELFAAFERRMEVSPRSSPGIEALEDLWLYLHLMMEAVWEYRFLYRELGPLLRRDRRVRDHFNRIADRKLEAISSLCGELAAAGAMRATPGEIDALASNVLVVATYWLEFGTLRGGEPDLARGAHQVMSLVAPYLVPAARRHLDGLARGYLDPH